MSIPLSIWRAQLLSARNAARQDVRIQVAVGISLSASIVLGLWGPYNCVPSLLTGNSQARS
ncbi:hypothetical protein [Dictyobacter kobayashii]|uniref:Uncharacterized protein n=1 Tax=Dictyobacter kobayashii TaxID=2014872 RepID=A0A402AJ78_9CHLR|nr:hypothetical protein [Dictyobacter kobayashii]GCE19110.1 hypothetical protein KDK_29100 [Dictyobacter kobayashii]